jgi:NCS1 family nucleobase:cation symporter-1
VRNGEYEFTNGFNIKAILSLFAGVFVGLIGLFVSELRFLYDYAWFIGFGVALLCYLLVMKK